MQKKRKFISGINKCYNYSVSPYTVMPTPFAAIIQSHLDSPLHPHGLSSISPPISFLLLFISLTLLI